MSRFSKQPKITVSDKKTLPGEVQAYELGYKLQGRVQDVTDTGMAAEDAIEYLRNSAGLKFPWFVERDVAWDTPEQGEFNANLII